MFAGGIWWQLSELIKQHPQLFILFFSPCLLHRPLLSTATTNQNQFTKSALASTPQLSIRHSRKGA